MKWVSTDQLGLKDGNGVFGKYVLTGWGKKFDTLRLRDRRVFYAARFLLSTHTEAWEQKTSESKFCLSSSNGPRFLGTHLFDEAEFLKFRIYQWGIFLASIIYYWHPRLHFPEGPGIT